ncbi:serine/threonine-protein phosphatase [Butyrivibrio sp. DSM 10294]|uniref:PP2C family protein-serine/threonine phosphatase n=1 Tax=Butyrivibrio sp. DSM 10294 TaxID=2972457 RepID=UPI00234E459A|nr:PP2C family protein-serine/threonine phosphatase [Butyrivibrio sp. DSM 10294]MDC7294539.1 serine/threonine-protein phosphatase [Butyrivibrio sp. DSM 10294]
MSINKNHSLAEKARSFTLLSCVAFGIVAQIMALTFYGVSNTKQLIRVAESAAMQAAMSAIHGADSLGFSREVMDIYNGLSDEEKNAVGTPAYLEHFSSIDTGSDSTYRRLINMLAGTKEYHNVYAVYIAMYDEQNSRIVYIADADDIDGQGIKPGEWEPVNKKGMMKFLNHNDSRTLYDIAWIDKYGFLCSVAVPMKDSAGNLCAFMLVDISISEEITLMVKFFFQLLIVLGAVTVLISYTQNKRIKKGLVEPINRIAQASSDYVKHKENATGEKSFFSTLDIHTGDEIENLCNVMSTMEKEMLDYETNLTKVTAQNERIETELSLATKIQLSMIPHDFPPFPDRKEFDIYASVEPAREVGGDFYDYFLIDDDHLCVLMADVSGKGIPAALFMMISKVIIQSCAMLGTSAAETLNKTNEAISSKNQTDMFVTVWLGILEISTGKLTCANAGHEYPVLKRSGGEYEIYKDKHGFVIGGMEGTSYKEYEITLEKGDRLFLYTDGVPEACDADNNMFGTERMLAALNESGSGSEPPSLQDTLTNVRSAVSDFVKDAEQFDDLTMLCLEYRG